jgi:hypothetical protein
MAKAPAKKTATSKAAEEKVDKPVKKAAPKFSLSPAETIEAASETSLAKLRDLNIAPQLQSEIDWCLASYRNDGNPVGLYEMVERAIAIFKDEQAKKTKGVTAKFVGELEKALATR